MHKQSIGVGLPYFENYSYKPGHNKLCTAHVQVHIYAITKSGSSNNVTHVQYVLSNDFIICPTDGHLHHTVSSRRHKIETSRRTRLLGNF